MEDFNERDKLTEIEQLITAFQDQLFKFAFFRTGSLADAQDIVQDVFVKLYKNETHPLFINNIKHYLLRSVSNACIDYNRKNKKQQIKLVERVNDFSNGIEENAAYRGKINEEYTRINFLLQSLPDEQAEVIRMRFIDELSFPEMAEITGVPITTVKSRFKYGIDKLKTIVPSKEYLL